MLFVLLIVGAVVLSRAPRSEDELAADEPLVWADVERQFERVDRAGGRPGPAGTGGPTPPKALARSESGVGTAAPAGLAATSPITATARATHRKATGPIPP